MIVVIAFLGAIVVTVLVVALGMFRQTLFSPHRVILAGAAIAILIYSLYSRHTYYERNRLTRPIILVKWLRFIT